MQNSLESALAAANMMMPPTILSTGFTRWGKNNRWYIIRKGDGYFFGDMATGFKGRWFPKNDSCVDYATLDPKSQRIEREKRYQEQWQISEELNNLWKTLPAADPKHLYLKTKGIMPMGSWLSLQSWSLNLRKRNISVMFVHHSNKMGGQRGSNKKEDVMDTVIVLKHPKNYTPSDGLRCEVHYEKARGFYGTHAKPFEIQMMDQGSSVLWKAGGISDDRSEKVISLHLDKLSQRKIADQLGINIATVNGIIREYKLSNPDPLPLFDQ